MHFLACQLYTLIEQSSAIVKSCTCMITHKNVHIIVIVQQPVTVACPDYKNSIIDDTISDILVYN